MILAFLQLLHHFSNLSLCACPHVLCWKNISISGHTIMLSIAANECYESEWWKKYRYLEQFWQTKFVGCFIWSGQARTTDTKWRHKSKKSEILGRCGRQNMLRSELKIWDWDLIFDRAVKAISSPGVRSRWIWIQEESGHIVER